MHILNYTPLLIAVIGGLVYMLTPGKYSEVGRIALVFGLVITAVAFAMGSYRF